MGGDLSKLYDANECGHVGSISDWESDNEVDLSRNLSTRSLGGALGNTVIIFDWDDTLLCSSALRAQNVKFEHLQQLEKAVATLLEAAMAVGETLIVTNGTETWVQESSAHFLPGLVPLLQGLHVTSARAHYEHLYPGDPFMWKRACFRDLLADSKRGVLANAKEVHLVVCGDSLAEIQAAHGALSDLNCSSTIVKTVKFKEIPTVAELLGQLRRLTAEFAKIAEADSTINKSLVQRALPANLVCMTTCASGWEMSDNLTWDQQGPPAVF